MDLELDATRATNARDDIHRATGLDLFCHYDARKRAWVTGLNDHASIPVEFATPDEAIDWMYWYAGAK